VRWNRMFQPIHWEDVEIRQRSRRAVLRGWLFAVRLAGSNGLPSGLITRRAPSWQRSLAGDVERGNAGPLGLPLDPSYKRSRQDYRDRIRLCVCRDFEVRAPAPRKRSPG